MYLRRGQKHTIRLYHSHAKKHSKIIQVVILDLKHTDFGLKVCYQGINQPDSGEMAVGRFKSSIIDLPETFNYEYHRKPVSTTPEPLKIEAKVDFDYTQKLKFYD